MARICGQSQIHRRHFSHAVFIVLMSGNGYHEATRQVFPQPKQPPSYTRKLTHTNTSMPYAICERILIFKNAVNCAKARRVSWWCRVASREMSLERDFASARIIVRFSWRLWNINRSYTSDGPWMCSSDTMWLWFMWRLREWGSEKFCNARGLKNVIRQAKMGFGPLCWADRKSHYVPIEWHKKNIL